MSDKNRTGYDEMEMIISDHKGVFNILREFDKFTDAVCSEFGSGILLDIQMRYCSILSDLISLYSRCGKMLEE